MKSNSYWHNHEKANQYISRLQEPGKNMHDIICGFLKEITIRSFSDPQINPGNNLLIDIGCGPGSVSAQFIEALGFKEFLAVDISNAMLDNVPGYVDIEKVRTTFQKADMNKDQLKASDQSANMVLSAQMIFYLADIENFFREVVRVLKPGGLFALSCLVHTQTTPRSIFCENSEYVMDTFAHSQMGIIYRLIAQRFEVFVSDIGPALYYTKKPIPVHNGVFLFRKRQ